MGLERTDLVSKGGPALVHAVLKELPIQAGRIRGGDAFGPSYADARRVLVLPPLPRQWHRRIR